MAGKNNLHRTHRGKTIDIDALRILNAGVVAVGNAKMNARGDVLGQGGIVKKTQEDKVKDYYQSQVKSNIDSNEDPAVYKPQVYTDDAAIAPMPRKRPRK